MKNTNQKSGRNYKKLIFICFLSVAIAIVISAAIFLIDIFKYNTGVVTKISTKATDNNTVDLKMTYFFSMGGYSVREVPLDEGEYIGERVVDYNGDLGKYRIIIVFGDMEPHGSFANRMNEDRIFDIENSVVPLKAKIANPNDHGFMLYIGSDTPISVENMADKELNPICGRIRIPIHVGNME